MARSFDDFKVGERFRSESAEITESEMLEFSRRFDPQPFHDDPEAAKETPYGGLIASGFHTIAFAFRLFLDTGAFEGCGLGSPGLDEVRWLRPVRPGDRLRMDVEVTGARPSGKDPGRGVLTLDYTVTNQEGESVLTMRGVTLVRREVTTG